jgi:hypothetical protein
MRPTPSGGKFCNVTAIILDGEYQCMAEIHFSFILAISMPLQ